jgi:hypothetical protein
MVQATEHYTASVKPWVQTLVLPKKDKMPKNNKKKPQQGTL